MGETRQVHLQYSGLQPGTGAGRWLRQEQADYRCDEGKLKTDVDLKPRARQNVVFEHGYLIQKLGRKRVAALVEDGVETPGDVSGVLYISLSDTDWERQVLRELVNCGLNVDTTNI